MRQKNFAKVRKVIGDSLFAAKPTFASHLREIWAAASELRSVPFTAANPTHMYQLQEWADLQVCVFVCMRVLRFGLDGRCL